MLSGRRIQNVIYSDDEDGEESEFDTQELLKLVQENRNQYVAMFSVQGS